MNVGLGLAILAIWGFTSVVFATSKEACNRNVAFYTAIIFTVLFIVADWLRL